METSLQFRKSETGFLVRKDSSNSLSSGAMAGAPFMRAVKG
jgi:hypothetical protein